MMEQTRENWVKSMIKERIKIHEMLNSKLKDEITTSYVEARIKMQEMLNSKVELKSIPTTTLDFKGEKKDKHTLEEEEGFVYVHKTSATGSIKSEYYFAGILEENFPELKSVVMVIKKWSHIIFVYTLKKGNIESVGLKNKINDFLKSTVPEDCSFTTKQVRIINKTYRDSLVWEDEIATRTTDDGMEVVDVIRKHLFLLEESIKRKL